MKKTAIMFLAAVFLLNACSPQNTSLETDRKVFVQENGSALSSSSVLSGLSADSTASESDRLMADEQVFTTFLELYERAIPVLFWYFSGPDEGSIEIKTDHPSSDGPYKMVGRFKTIEEMKAATEEAFTRRFCEDLFYDHAFVDLHGEDMPMYKEVDGALYWNTQIGGFGWPYKLTDQYTVSLQTEDLIVLLVKSNVIDYEEWNTFVMKKENGSWKIEKLHDLSPYAEFERAVKPAVSAWFCAQDWDDPNEIDANSLLVFYADQFLSDKKISDYNVEDGYAVPSEEVLENFSTCFVGLRMDTLTKVKDAQYASASYDEATDSFIFYLTRDPAGFVICSDEVSQGTIRLRVLVIAKNDKASYWGDLTVDSTEDGLRYLSNQFTDIVSE